MDGLLCVEGQDPVAFRLRGLVRHGRFVAWQGILVQEHFSWRETDKWINFPWSTLPVIT
ncbi:hypothetical protein [Rhodococcoides fascians]|uniref:hypothetical protein n=1 Tax=Rhodococcoides fascians TaxID=1828 RepID=UPI000B284F7D|nr:hypothetical protein [Rhodococcus fascians]